MENSSSTPNSLQIRRRGEVTAVITLSGRVDAEVAKAFLATVEQEARECPRMVVDLAEVRQMGSDGLGAMVRALKVARDSGGDLVLARPTAAIRELLGETGLDTVLRSHESVAEAEAEVGKRE